MKLHPPTRTVTIRTLSTLRRKQTGATLIVTIMLLMVLTILALSLYQFSNTEERNARNQFDRNLAMQAAELALRDAEMDLQCLRRVPPVVPPAAPPAHAYEFCKAGTVVTAGKTTLCRADACGRLDGQETFKTLNTRKLKGFTLDGTPETTGGTGGLWLWDGLTATQPWKGKSLSGKEYLDDPAATQAVTLGTQTNVEIPDIYKNRPPRYMIEGFKRDDNLLFRITSRGWGNLPGTVVTLQEIYKP